MDVMKKKRVRVDFSRSERGVTLIELMVVVVLIGILATLSSPYIVTAMDRTNAAASARDIGNVLRMARNQAMSRGQALWVVVHLAGEPGYPNGGAEIFNAGAVTPPPRSCRQFNVAYLVPGNQVFELNALRGRSQVRQIEGTTFNTVCFNPDGRVTQRNGQVLGSNGFTCAESRLAIAVVDLDVAPPNVTSSFTCAGVGGGAAKREERQLYNTFAIYAPYNGAVTVEQ